ncbi:hypothetical protein D3C78_1704840 [compost metagenome]
MPAVISLTFTAMNSALITFSETALGMLSRCRMALLLTAQSTCQSKPVIPSVLPITGSLSKKRSRLALSQSRSSALCISAWRIGEGMPIHCPL